jgi:hypothetical protein
MANTPHISVRVPPAQLEKWRENCDEANVDVSHQIRRLMDAWCYSRSLEKEARELLQMEQP